MTPQPPTAQADLDLAEKIIKWVLSLAALAGTATALVRWLRRRREARDARYAARIESIVRAGFAKEIANLNIACTNVDELRGFVLANTTTLVTLQSETIKAMHAGDELIDEFISLVRDNREWLDDLQNFIDHAHGIDRRSSIGQDRRVRIDERFDTIQERRSLRRRSSDTLHTDLKETRKRETELNNHGDTPS